MVRLRTLTPSIEVRILAGHPAFDSARDTFSRPPASSRRSASRRAGRRSMRGGRHPAAPDRAPALEGRSSTPVASPAWKAAPSAVVSRCCGRSTGHSRMSARNWHSQSLAAIPPSTRSAGRRARTVARHRFDQVERLVGDRFQRRPRQVRAGRVERQPEDRARAPPDPNTARRARRRPGPCRRRGCRAPGSPCCRFRPRRRSRRARRAAI